MIALIVARASNGVIGSKNDLPWYLPADLKHFKELTTDHTVIMGRKTYESIFRRLNGPLPNRRNIVISHTLIETPDGFELANSLEAALTLAGEATAFIIGGATIYKAILEQELADKIYLTDVKQDIAGDTYFPELDTTEWKETSREPHQSDEKNSYNYDFVTYEHSKRA